ncbi:MAG: glycosyltransferase family 4 protein [Anaerolineae bacterium]|jgi:glycosyltransferase involved in cell wall biosynthesis|nr:glycosyltransferase family 4 protein [Anaerolineae bacterium]MBT7483186.1 glycosyltransferase family 4 protein [Candidatus Peregrinibacteria bacterium]MBT4841954.1 glycosyltransferase family 4 protein [Anaerolineae bacterium]MBT6060842.1 glycosyltransferase family 4 protein [Anaerolineae bacterium]MBT6321560.1 glycosyltransferase family 4 protein [Anaerolineae bacterium]
MKILAIAMSRIPSPNANGIQVMKVCQALTQLGHDLTLLVPDMEPWGSTRAEISEHYGLEKTFKIRWISTKSRRTFTWRALREARKSSPDLIYSWSPQSTAFSLLHRLPTIHEMHEPPLGRFGPLWYRAFLRLGGDKRLVTITRALRDLLDADYGIPSDVVIAPNGVDLEQYETNASPKFARQNLGIEEAPTVCCTGHLYAGRGVETFLRLAEKSPGANFLWVGGQPDDVHIWRGRASKLRNVKFTGFIHNAELPLYQSAADILIAPYESKIAGSSGGDSASVASPMKIFDYMAAKRPIITSDLPVIREVLNEDAAIFCPPDDVDAWHAAVTRLLDDDALRDKLAENAYALVGENTWLARQKKILAAF